MKTLILIIYGEFEDDELLEEIIEKIVVESKDICSIKYIIKEKPSLILILETDTEFSIIANSFFEILSLNVVRFYFIFDRSSLVSAHIPIELKDKIFKLSENTDYSFEYFYEEEPKDENFQLDELLEKIKQYGTESLTEEEKKFLDNFFK
jgi:hypothetical protein